MVIQNSDLKVIFGARYSFVNVPNEKLARIVKQLMFQHFT
jgi:hypothetical protein